MDKEPEDEEFEDFEDDFEEFEDDEDALEDEDAELEEDEVSEATAPTPRAAPSRSTPPIARHDVAEGEHIAANLDQPPLTNPKEIPMHVVVEVGRLKMSVQKLMDLQPGNVLDLNLSPEDGVDLTVNGRCIAKGELLKVGDVLGVRILDIG